MAVQHLPVLYAEALEGLRVRPGGLYIDATLGGCGHAAGILHSSGPAGRLLGLDADPEAIRFARQALREYSDRATLQVANFSTMGELARAHGFGQVDGILMDLGLSSRQLADAGRGFAFGLDGPLDMRFDPSRGRPASELVNTLPEAELARLLFEFGDERLARRIARAVVSARPLTTTRQLAELVARTIGRRERIDPATRTFQALRIAVNDELGSLSSALPQARDLLMPGGRLVVISFHSLEDGIVKRFCQLEAARCICPPEVLVCACGHVPTLKTITRKPIRPGADEVARNPRSRSARLRICERLA